MEHKVGVVGTRLERYITVSMQLWLGKHVMDEGSFLEILVLLVLASFRGPESE